MENKLSDKLECKMQHLEFIQNIITRMNSNSFTLKETTVVIITACIGIYATNQSVSQFILLLPIFPAIIIWFLDSYYLQQERQFRKIYNVVVEDLNNGTNVIQTYKMPINKYTEKDDKTLGYWNVFCSKTVWTFYIMIILVSVISFAFIKFC